MNAELEQLKTLVKGDDWDAESKEYIAKLEEQFEKAVADDKLLTIPSVVDYVAYLKLEIERCKEFLSEQTLKLTETHRIQLHERKEACREFLNYFEPQKRVEHTIKQTLNAFQGKKDLE